MSLINEALKKAQRQRTDPSPAPVPATESAVATGGTASRIAKRRPPMPARTLMLLITGGSAVFLMACVLAFLYWRADEATVIRAMHPFRHIPPIPPQAPAVIPSVVLPPIPTVVSPDRSSPVPITPPALPKPDPAPIRPEPVVPVANPLVESFLSTLRITGVRTSETDPKVIMNDRIFRLNDIVDRATGLRMTRVESSVLEFTDASGFKYTKLF